MLLHVGMIRRALKCNIQSDFKPVSIGAGDKFLEIFLCSQLRINGGMAALIGANRPGAAYIIRLRRDGIVLPFPECLSDRMDWREVHDIETHGGNVGKPGLAVAESSHCRPGSGRATSEILHTRSKIAPFRDPPQRPIASPYRVTRSRSG